MNPEDYVSKAHFEQSQKQINELIELLKKSQAQTDELIDLYKNAI